MKHPDSAIQHLYSTMYACKVSSHWKRGKPKLLTGTAEEEKMVEDKKDLGREGSYIVLLQNLHQMA